MNTNLTKQLSALNLSENESKVYVALLEHKQSPAGPLVKETLLHRSVVYESLNRLISKKLAFKLEKNNIAYFQATDPKRILENIKLQEAIAIELVPQLASLIAASQPEINVYEGIESYRNFWLNSTLSLPEGSTDYIAGSIGKNWQELMGKDTNRFIKYRIKRKIIWKMIVFDKDDLELDLLRMHPELHEYRLINRRVGHLGNFNIFNDSSIILHSTVEPMVIEIKSKSLVGVFKNLFDILWETGTKL